MKVRDAIHTLELRIYANRPRWLAWIDDAPPVCHAYIQGQRAYWFHLLPYTAALLTVLYLSNYFGTSLPGYPWSLALALAGLAVLLAAPPYRVGIAALRSLSISPYVLHSRLRVLASVSLFLAALGTVLVLGFLWAAVGALGASR